MLVKENIRNAKVPYLASDVWFEDARVEEMKIPSKWDQNIYKDYVEHTLDELDNLASEVPQQGIPLSSQQNSAPVSTPRLFPSVASGASSLPPPAYATIGPPNPSPLTLPHSRFLLQPPGLPPPGVPPPGMIPGVPPPGMLTGVPPPAVLQGVPPPVVPPAYQPTISYPKVSSFSVSGSTPNNTGLINTQTPAANAASTLEREFFAEKETILIDGDIEPPVRVAPSLSSQQQEPVRVRQGSSASIELNREIDKLSRQICQNSVKSARGLQEYDKFGYAVRSGASAEDGDPAEVYRRMFPEGATPPRRRKRTASRSRSPNKRRRQRSRSRGRRTRSPSRGRRTRSKSKSGGRRTRSRSRNRKRTTRSRSRSRSRDRRRTRERTTRSRSRDRRRRTRRPSSRSERRRSRSRSRQKKTKSRSRSKSKSKCKSSARPPVPRFMMHPADRLFSGEAARSKSVRKRMEMRAQSGYDNVDTQKAGLIQTLELIKNMAADEGETLKQPVVVTIEVEILDDGRHRQFTQLGVGCEDKETGIYNRSMFKAILPTEMAAYERNLILKHQINLHSSLKFKFDETNNSYTFLHVKKGEVQLVSEETALRDLISFLDEIQGEDQVVLLTLNISTFIPLLVERLIKYDLLAEFSEKDTIIFFFLFFSESSIFFLPELE